ncbi:hypothetical protein MNV49_001853 [Pseudohyphozyma bogoriensis]|nr:hypothetical protein MNV49_001853 [Pseudohyphozyma bogoriensis]
MTTSSQELELIVLGTGTSSGVPSIGCLTSPTTGCYTCRSTLSLPSETDPHAKHNLRRNTSAVLRIPDNSGAGGRTKTLLIDCGKTFYSAALEHWPKKGLREIDALLITHPHADAILGLDDLRGWTLHQNVQKSIQIWCNQHTYDEVSKTFPYLADVKKATGGGDVPQFDWCIFDDTKPFELLGVRVVPLPVHHGQYFTTPPTPFKCLGFLFNSEICYLSDVSFIPPEIWAILEEECLLPSKWRPALTSNGEQVVPPTETAAVPAPVPTDAVKELSLLDGVKSLPTKEKKRLKALVIDCLRIESHMSHFGWPQAIAAARRMGPERTYLVGFGHQKSHASWVSLCRAFQANASSSVPLQSPPLTLTQPKPPAPWHAFGGTENPGVEDWKVNQEWAMYLLECWEGGKLGGFWVRPAADGMKIMIGGKEGDTIDDLYGYEG